jgi:hypothetical protein
MRYLQNVSMSVSLLAAFMLVSLESVAFTKQDVSDRSKPIWTDFTIKLYHPFITQTPFGGLNVVLCLFNRSSYKDFVNFKKIEDEETPFAYLATLDDNRCENSEDDLPRIFRVEQSTSDSPLTIETWAQPSGTGADDRAKIVLKEEVTATNPYGIMDLAWNFIDDNEEHIYSWSSSSNRLDDGRIQYKTVSFVDLVLVSSGISAGSYKDFYSANIVHDESGGGYGSVIARRNNGDGGFPSMLIKNIDIAYNNEFLLFKDKLAGQPSEVCLSRQASWQYVQRDGYGVYDSNGDRISEQTNVTYNNNGVLEPFVVGSAITGSTVDIPYASRSLEDGRILAEGSLNSSTLPKFSLPDGAIVVGDNNQKYLVRVLKPFTVYAHVDIGNCTNSGLVIGTSLKTPDHNMIDRLLGEIPATGALLLNDFQPGDSLRDPTFSGAVYIAEEDTDDDGVLNYKDAFPLDPLKSTDADYDGVDDLEDSDVNQIIFSIPEYPGEMTRSAEEGNADF